MARPESSAPPPNARKAVLICPACDHESPPDGDWLTREESWPWDRRIVYECPVCGEDINARPVFDADRTTADSPRGHASGD